MYCDSPRYLQYIELFPSFSLWQTHKDSGPWNTLGDYVGEVYIRSKCGKYFKVQGTQQNLDAIKD